uniref:ABC transporter domain-containing protein n=1 Tax=Salmo trutta TaxID=8032 RepID=A0A674D1K9_SALTR
GNLEFQNVSFAYPTRKDAPIFQDLSLSVPAGSVMAVVGPSGSGKSTLLLAFRVITIDGHDVRDLNPYWLRSHIGTVSQVIGHMMTLLVDHMFPLLWLSCSGNPPGCTDRQRLRVCPRFPPEGFDSVVGEKGVLLSGGQKKRIAIARALLKNPKILLLDEATSAHDAENDFLVQEALERLMDGRKVLIIAHRLTTIQNADAVAVLGQRCVVDCGQHAQLLGNRQGLFRKLMEKQTFFQEGQKQALKRAEDRGALKM